MVNIASILRDGEDPSMPALRAWLQGLSSTVSAAASGFRTFADVAALNAYTPAAGEPTYAFVLSPAFAPYRFPGALPWVKDETYYQGISQIVQPDIDQAATDLRAEVGQATESVAPSALVLDLRDGTGSAVAANGATFIERVGAIVGLSVAAGSTGQGAYLNVIKTTAIKPAGLAGVRSRIDLSFAVSPSFNRAVSRVVYSFDQAETANQLDPIGSATVAIVDGIMTMSGVYDIPASAIGFQQTATLTSSNATAAVQTIELLNTSFRPAVADAGVARSDVALDARERQLFAAVKSDQRIYGREILVTALGQGGEFSTIKAAIASAQPHAGPGSRALIRIAPKSGGAAYAERSIAADYIDLVSATPELVTIDASQPNNASPADITAYSAFDYVGDCSMERLNVVIANGRYGVHWDDARSAGKLWKAKDCTFWHKGNEGARQYQISQGRDPDTFGTQYYIWRTVCAVGAGTWDDSHAEFYNSVFRSPAYPFAVHDQAAAPYGPKASTLLFDACLIQSAVTVNPATGAVTEGDPAGIGAFEFTTYGQPVTNRVILRNSTVLGKIDVTKPGTGTATRSRWVFDGEGNSPLTWNVPFAGGAPAVSRIL